jgi:hypothetical protein
VGCSAIKVKDELEKNSTNAAKVMSFVVADSLHMGYFFANKEYAFSEQIGSARFPAPSGTRNREMKYAAVPDAGDRALNLAEMD